MGTFSDTIRLTVDVVAGQTQGFKGFLSGLKTDVGEAEGAFGKFRAAGAGAMSFVSDNAGALVAGAGTAIAAFAVSSVGDFQKVAGSVGELRDAFGLSAEDASRWVEVSGDLGIGADKLEASMKKMLQTAGASPGTFDKLGVEIAHAKDGSVDASATFLNVIDRLHGMKDPADQAAAAQQLLGRSWVDSAELIGLGADGVKARLDEVSGAKILTDEQIGQSRQFRDAMDNLGDVVDNLKLRIAEGLVPSLTSLADTAVPVLDFLTHLKTAFDDAKDSPGILGTAFSELVDHLNPVGAAFGKVQEWFGLWQDEPKKVAPEVVKMADAVKAAVLGLTPNIDAIQTSFDKIQADRLQAALAQTTLTAQENVAAYTEMATGLHAIAVGTEAYDKAASSSDWGKSELEGALTANKNYTDQLFALSDIATQNEAAIDAFGESIKNADGNVSAATLTMDVSTESGRKQIEAVKGIADTLDNQFAAAYDAADGDMSNFMGRANTISNDTLARLQQEFGLSKEQVDTLRGSLGLTAKDWQARFEMSGDEEAKQKVGLLQASIQSVTDPVWQAKIATLIAAGDWQGALAAIQSHFNNNPVTVQVNAVPGHYSGLGNGTGNIRAIGGTPAPNEITTAGEYGPEVIDWRLGRPKFVPRAESANIAASQAGTNITNVYVESGDPVKIAAAIDRVMWFRNAGPRKAA